MGGQNVVSAYVVWWVLLLSVLLPGADAVGWSESGRRPWESALLDIGLAATRQLGEEKGEE